MKLNSLSVAMLTAGLSSSLFAAPASKNPLADKPFANQTAQGFDLTFSDKNARTLTLTRNGERFKVRAVEKIVYVKNPVEAEYQTLNFYVPEAYFTGETVNGYSKETAPIFLPNSIGGYMPAIAKTAEEQGMGGKESAIVVALSKGYVVASVGAIGRTLEKAGKYTGKAPAAIVDLKAAVRYLHQNDALMAGDANKIISNGTSAGGALSALLGVSGDHPDFAEQLKAIGAADASGAIFAVSAYCPITNLENADTAYEWEFNGLNEYSRMDMSRLNATSYNDRSKGQPPKIEGVLSEREQQVSAELKAAFPAYLNSLNLKDEKGNPLHLDEKGEGSFKTYLKSYLIESANKAVKSGQNVADTSWVKMADGKVVDIDWHGYIHSAKRMKSPPAFDALDLSSGENNLFGTETVNNQHFTPYALKNSTKQGGMASSEAVKLMNAMNYTENANGAKHYRIRAGTADRDTSHAISAILATKLKMTGKNVDYALPWGVPHSGDYDLDELFQWTDTISKPQK